MASEHHTRSLWRSYNRSKTSLHFRVESALRNDRTFRLVGLENYYQFMPHSLSARMHDTKLVKEKARLSDRAQLMGAIAADHQLNFSESTAGTLNLHNFIYLRRGDMRQENNVMTGDYAGCHVKLFDYSHTAAPDYYAEHHHTLIILRPLVVTMALPELVLTPGNYLERYLVGFDEVDVPEVTAGLREHRLYTRSDNPNALGMIRKLLALLDRHPGIYLEIHDGALLAFCPDRDLETAEGIEALFELVDLLCHAEP